MTSKDLNHIDELKKDLKAIVNGINPRVLLGYLKDHERLGTQILVGFRANVTSVKMPAVRNRILNEAEKDDEFLEKLGTLLLADKPNLLGTVLFDSATVIKQLDELVETNGRLAVKVALLLDDRQNVRNLLKYLKPESIAERKQPEVQPEIPEIEAISDQAEVTLHTPSVKELNAEKTAKEKIKKHEQRISDLEKAVESLRSEKARKDAEIKTLKTEISEHKKNLAISEKQADRQRRENEKTKQDKLILEEEIKSLKGSIRDLQTEVIADKTVKAVNETSRTPDWLPIINKMISTRKFSEAQSFCDVLCLLNPNDMHAHVVLIQICKRTSDISGEAEEWSIIARIHLNSEKFKKSFFYSYNALELSTDNDKIQSLFRQVLNKIDLNNGLVVKEIRHRLVTMRLNNHPAYRQAMKIIKQLGRQYEKTLIDIPETLSLDKNIDFSDVNASLQISIRSIIDSINTNDISRVESIKCALRAMKKKKPELYASIMKTIDENDKSCRSVLNGDNLGTVVVDGSNVAWHECTKPRLCNIFQLRDELRVIGYFPIYIYADAALERQIDREVDLQRMVDTGAVIMADCRTDADGVIVEYASRLQCPVVTNDRMLDWDPQGKVRKIRFNISKSGAEIYD